MLETLYLLVFPKQGAFKIGRAKGVHRRSKSFSWFGDPDYAGSYSALVHKDRISEIEKGLHKLLSIHRANDIPSKDGYTEIFRLGGLEVALKLLNNLAENHETIGSIRKGIDIPMPSLGSPSARPLKTHRPESSMWKSKSKQQVHHLQTVYEKLAKIERLLIFLNRFHHRIPFRLRKTKSSLTIVIANKYFPHERTERSDFRELFNFNYFDALQKRNCDDGGNWLGGIATMGDFTEVEFRLPEDRELKAIGIPTPSLIIHLVGELPETSAAAAVMGTSLPEPGELSLKVIQNFVAQS